MIAQIGPWGAKPHLDYHALLDLLLQVWRMCYDLNYVFLLLTCSISQTQTGYEIASILSHMSLSMMPIVWLMMSWVQPCFYLVSSLTLLCLLFTCRSMRSSSHGLGWLMASLLPCVLWLLHIYDLLMNASWGPSSVLVYKLEYLIRTSLSLFSHRIQVFYSLKPTDPKSPLWGIITSFWINELEASREAILLYIETGYSLDLKPREWLWTDTVAWPWHMMQGLSGGSVIMPIVYNPLLYLWLEPIYWYF